MRRSAASSAVLIKIKPGAVMVGAGARTTDLALVAFSQVCLVLRLSLPVLKRFDQIVTSETLIEAGSLLMSPLFFAGPSHQSDRNRLPRWAVQQSSDFVLRHRYPRMPPDPQPAGEDRLGAAAAIQAAVHS